MTWLDQVPTINVALVAMSAFFLVYGWTRIKKRDVIHGQRGDVAGHQAAMLTATGLFALFLTLYAIRLIIEGPTSFPGPAPWRTPYYAFLFTHMSLALLTVGLLIPTLRFALTKQFHRHRRVAPWTFRLWLVSDTMGIVVYFMLFVIWVGP